MAWGPGMSPARPCVKPQNGSVFAVLEFQVELPGYMAVSIKWGEGSWRIVARTASAGEAIGGSCSTAKKRRRSLPSTRDDQA